MTLLKIELCHGEDTPGWAAAKIAHTVDPKAAQATFMQVREETPRGITTRLVIDKEKMFKLCLKHNIPVALEDGRLYYTPTEQTAVIEYLKYNENPIVQNDLS